MTTFPINIDGHGEGSLHPHSLFSHNLDQYIAEYRLKVTTFPINIDGRGEGSLHPHSRFSHKFDQHSLFLFPQTLPQKTEEGLEKKSAKGEEAGRGMEEPFQSVRNYPGECRH